MVVYRNPQLNEPRVASTLPGIPPRPRAPLTVGISLCLTGEAVRYDGSDAYASLPHLELSGLFDFRGFCPEVGIGMGIPRTPIRLVGEGEDCRVLGLLDARLDKTAELIAYAESQVPNIAPLAGYVFMQNSPSCGTQKVKVYARPDASPVRRGTGVFARTVIAALPHLPVTDADRLFDAGLRGNFLTSVYVYGHWQRLPPDPDIEQLIAFHNLYKYLLMAHSTDAHRAVVRLLRQPVGKMDLIADTYIGLLMGGLRQLPARANHVAVLSGLRNLLEEYIDPAVDRELTKLIQAYAIGDQPLAEPKRLLKTNLQHFPELYLEPRSYFEPYPGPEVMRSSP